MMAIHVFYAVLPHKSINDNLLNSSMVATTHVKSRVGKSGEGGRGKTRKKKKRDRDEMAVVS